MLNINALSTPRNPLGVTVGNPRPLIGSNDPTSGLVSTSPTPTGTTVPQPDRTSPQNANTGLSRGYAPQGSVSPTLTPGVRPTAMAPIAGPNGFNDGLVPGYTPPGSTPPPAAATPTTPSAPALPGPIGGGNRPSTWAADYNPSQGGFIWRDGTMHGAPEPSQGSPTLANGQPDPNYFAGGPTTDVFGNSLGSKNWGNAPTGNSPVNAPNPFASINPYQSNPGYSGPDASFNGGYNPLWFGSDAAGSIAQKLFPGSSLYSENSVTNAPGSPIQQNQPNSMLRLPNGQSINVGYLASLYGHGLSGGALDQYIGNETGGLLPDSSVQGASNPTPNPNTLANPAAPTPQQQNSINPLNSNLSNGQNLSLSTLISLLSGGGYGQSSSGQPNTSLIQQLYGGNPYGLLSGAGVGTLSNSSSSMTNIAQLINLLSSLGGQQTQGGTLNPLFWGAGNQVPQSSYFPSFY